MTMVGKGKSALDTPAVRIDLGIMEGNIAYLAEFLHQAGVAWRPHTKGIKVPAITHRFLDAGAIGITCGKLSEADVMAAAGTRLRRTGGISSLVVRRGVVISATLAIGGQSYIVGPRSMISL